MHNIITNFDQILEFAEHLKVPIDKKRGIIREYLQVKFISILYSLPKSQKLSFVGGTSLRLLRNSNRFSEDLDFDNLGLSNEEIKALVQEVVRRFQVEGLDVEFKIRTKIEKGLKNKIYFDLRFPNLLKELEISTNPREKLMIKFDYANLWKGQVTETVLLNKYGFIENVVLNNLNQTIVQKLTAYVRRKITQPRDIYDVVWLYSQGAKVDVKFAEVNGLGNIVKRAQDKYHTQGIPKNFKNKLLPFLFNPEDARKLDLFDSVLKELGK